MFLNHLNPYIIHCKRKRESACSKYIKRNVFNKHLNTYHLYICNYIF